MQVVSSTTTMPPEPTTAPAAMSASYSTGVSNMLAGMQPPLGPPIWTALAGVPPWHAAADAVDQLVERQARSAPRPGRCA